MKLYLIHNIRMPTEKAHGWQVAKMCESLASCGTDIELIVPERINDIRENIFDYYGIRKNFKIKYLKSFDVFKYETIIGSKLSFYLQSLFFSWHLKKLLIAKEGIVLSRNPEIVQIIRHRNIRVFYDAHRWPESKNIIFKKMLKNCAGIICNSGGTAEKFRENGFTNILLAPNGVDLADYDLSKTKGELRKDFTLPTDKKIIMYVGHLYEWKGVDLILDLAELTKDNDRLFVFVGGTRKDLEKYKLKVRAKELGNILFLGHQKKAIMPSLQSSADVLLLPNIPISQESEKYTSPLKMFEYLASGAPIIASDLPSIREVLNESNAVLFRAGDFNDLNKQLNKLLNKEIDGGKIVEQAKIDAQKYSWLSRAEKIIKFIK